MIYNQCFEAVSAITGGIAGAIAGNQAGTIADELKTIDNQANEAIATMDSNQAGAIAGAIAEIEKTTKAICYCKLSKSAIGKDLGNLSPPNFL